MKICPICGEEKLVSIINDDSQFKCYNCRLTIVGDQQNIAHWSEAKRAADGYEKDLEKLLSIIPECPAHGKCISHATEWIERIKTLGRIIIRDENP